MSNPTSNDIDVLVCTYRRPELLVKTLDGIAHCASGNGIGAVRIIIVDNDDRQSAREVTRQWAQRSAVAVTYLLQPQQNISLTRNMALDHSTAPWIAFIDDDEVPDADWLSALLAAALHFDADVVFAPVISEFEKGAPNWATQSKLFQRKRFATGTVIPLKETRTGNLLLRSSRLVQDGFRFDPALGLSGGEDSEMFRRLSEAGYRMVWCDDACVREWTPASRTRLSWILKRAFRVGSVDAYNKRRFRRFREALVMGIKCSIFMAQGSVLGVFWAPISSIRCVHALFRLAMGVGFFYGLFAGPYRQYQAAASQTP